MDLYRSKRFHRKVSKVVLNHPVVTENTYRHIENGLNPTDAAKKAVIIPIVVTIFNAIDEYSNIGEHLTTKKTPAVTIVAA